MGKAFDKAAWQAEQEAKLELAQAALAKGLGELVTSDDWSAMLRSMAILGGFSIRRYSFRNIILLMSQRAGVRRVGTFKAWQSVGRSVRKGEKALMILAPRLRPVTEKEQREAVGPGWDGEMLGRRQKRLIGFKPVAVFALEQTDGAELPQVSLPTLTADEAFENSVEILRKVTLSLPDGPVSSIEIRERRGADGDSVGGWYEPRTKRIVVLSDVPRVEQFATLCHEVAHAILHGAGDRHSTPEREVEAESVAYVVCHALGVEVGERCFPYVASWATGRDALSMVEASGERIVKASRLILEALVPADEDVTAVAA